ETGEGGEAGETDETEEVFSGEELELEDNVEEKKDQELKKNARKKLKKMDFSDSSSSSESEPERVPEPKPKPKPNPKTKMVELKKQKKSEQAGKKSGREYKDWVAEEFMELIPGLATGDNIQKRKLLTKDSPKDEDDGVRTIMSNLTVTTAQYIIHNFTHDRMPAWLKKVSTLVIDEQMLSMGQMVMLVSILKLEQLMLVGDPNQLQTMAISGT